MSKSPPRLMKELCGGQESRQLDTNSSNASIDYVCQLGRREISKTKKLRISSRWLSRVIEISFNLKTGAGGWSMSQSLKAPVIITSGCPAYDDFEALRNVLRKSEKYGDYFQSVKTCLSNRKLDLSCVVVHTSWSSGYPTLLEVRIPSIFSALPGMKPDFRKYFLVLNMPWGESEFEGSGRVIDFLLDESGGSVNCDFRWGNDFWTRSPLREKDVPLILRLVDSGLNLDVEGHFRWTPYTKPNLLLFKSTATS